MVGCPRELVETVVNESTVDGQDGVGRCRVRSLVAGSWLWFDARVAVLMSKSTSCQSMQVVKWSAVSRQGKIAKAATIQVVYCMAVIFYA
ncbi:unnamed protein product [Haemonchus placei]|uniref:Uncharacterized protein n=1 Tax=Haemonchus placei TaxID=6290 RepID=A0A0N4W9Y3_HAEPC|nr:unnamed protein product [Haemonchus placei]